MACPHCGHTEVGFCPKCDEHYFRVGVTIHNDSAIAALKERKALTDKKDAEIKKLNKRIGKLHFTIGMILAVVILLCGRWKYIQPVIDDGPEPCEAQKITITRPISFNSEERLAPGEWVTGDFPMEEYRRVTINVMAECKDYVEESLRISLLDEYNFWMFESDQHYDEIDTIGARSYSFSGGLDRGRYFIVLQNTSDIQEIVIKVNASLSYEQDDPSPCSQAAGPDPHSSH